MRLFKLFTIVMLLPIIAFANTGKRSGKFTKEKTIHKEFEVEENTQLQLFNNSGNVTVSTWDKNTIAINAQVIVNGNSESAVKSDLEAIYIDFLNLPKKKKLIVETKQHYNAIVNHREIHYQIQIPETCRLYVSNVNGDIVIDVINTDVILGVNYGNIIANELNGYAVVNVSYSAGTKIRSAKTIDFYSNFSDVKINKVESVFFAETISSNIYIGEASSLTYQGESGTLDVGYIAKNLNIISGNYTIFNFSDISEKSNVKIKAKYGALTVGSWKSYKNDIDVYRTKLSIGYSKNTPFNLRINSEADVIMASWSIKREILQFPPVIRKNLIKLSNVKYKGYYLKNNSGRFLNLKLSESILRFHKIEMPIANK